MTACVGALEALLEYLRTHDPPVPVAQVNIGPVHKRDITKASTMLEQSPEHAVVLAFDVPVTPEAHAVAQEMGVTVFSANIIYHLTDAFEEHMRQIKESKQEAAVCVAYSELALIGLRAVRTGCRSCFSVHSADRTWCCIHEAESYCFGCGYRGGRFEDWDSIVRDASWPECHFFSRIGLFSK